jgi:hypothetical protein
MKVIIFINIQQLDKDLKHIQKEVIQLLMMKKLKIILLKKKLNYHYIIQKL